MRRAYIYPMSANSANINKVVAYNPYIEDFIESMSSFFYFVNKGNPSTIGIFDIIKYLFRIDCIFFNWIENIPDKKGGLAQTIFLIFLLSLFRLLNIKVIWTMHNKISHSNDRLFLKKWIFKTLINRSDKIITHSSEGIQYAESFVPSNLKKILYLPHPVKKRINKTNCKKFDILIWGTMSPYKGIVEFLEHIYKLNYQNKYKILVVGRSESKNYLKQLLQYSNHNIIIRDECPNEDDLGILVSQSKLVLFTYIKSSILGSGALMDSLGFRANIIGPNVGAFADLEKEGLIKTFNSFDELILIIDNEIHCFSENNEEKLDYFLQNNSWFKYAETLSRELTI